MNKIEEIKNKIRYIYYRLRWELAPYWLPKAPIHIDIETTSRCQLKCNMCPHSESPKKFPIGDMEWAILENILREGAQIGVMSCKLQWRGEPTLYKQLPDVIDLAKKLGYIDIMINTNGNYPIELNKKLINLTTCIFSVDTLDADHYKQIRVGGNLGKALENMQELKKLNPKMIIVAQMRVQKINENDVVQFKAFFEKKGFEVNISQVMQRTGDSNYTLGNLKAVGRKDCLMPRRRLLIDWQGNVYPCCCQWFGEKSLGNIANNTLKEIWEGYEIQSLRGFLACGCAFSGMPCKSCFSKESYLWK